jgi:hypothetical protein
MSVSERVWEGLHAEIKRLRAERDELLAALDIFVAAMEPNPHEYDNLLQGAYHIARNTIAKVERPRMTAVKEEVMPNRSICDPEHNAKPRSSAGGVPAEDGK